MIFTKSPLRNSVELVVSITPLGKIFRAIVSERVALRVSAWALPLPSATASAKLANKTVENKIRVIIPFNSRC